MKCGASALIYQFSSPPYGEWADKPTANTGVLAKSANAVNALILIAWFHSSSRGDAESRQTIGL